MRDSQPIRDIHFSNPRAPKLGVEILSLESLFKRKLNGVLVAPQRVHFYHIFLFTHGSGIHSIDFTPYDFDNRTLLLIAKGQVQQFEVNQANKGLLIVFTSEFLYENATPSNLAHSLQVFEHALFSPCLRLTEEEHQQLLGLCRDFQREYDKLADDLSPEILQHWLRMLLLYIERLQQGSDSSRRLKPYYQEFVAFRRLVERDLAQSRNVQYYAQQLAVSPKKLNVLTRQRLNKTAKEFIDEQVILESQRLLAQGDMPIKEIAYHLGFSELTNFVKFFKKHTRMTPITFRRRFHPSA